MHRAEAVAVPGLAHTAIIGWSLIGFSSALLIGAYNDRCDMTVWMFVTHAVCMYMGHIRTYMGHIRTY